MKGRVTQPLLDATYLVVSLTDFGVAPRSQEWGPEHLDQVSQSIAYTENYGVINLLDLQLPTGISPERSV